MARPSRVRMRLAANKIHDDEMGQDDVEVFAIARERQSEQIVTLGAGAGSAASEPCGAAEEILQHELRGERGDGEIKALKARRRASPR